MRVPSRPRRTRPSTSLLLAVAVATAVTAPSLSAATVADEKEETERESVYASAAHAFTVGKLLASEGEFIAASAALAEAAERSEDPYALIEYAKVLMRTGRSQEALAVGRRARSLAPEDPDVARDLARIHIGHRRGRPASLRTAAGLLEEALKLDPDDRESLQALGRIYQQLGEPEAAERRFRAILELHPGSRTASTLLLQTLLEEGEREEAVALLRDRLEHDPDNAELRLTLVDLLLESDRPDEALSAVEAAPAAVRERPAVQRRMAAALYRNGRTDEALSRLDRLVASDAANASVRFFRALLLIESGERGRALAELEELHRRHPENVEYAVSLMQLLLDGGEGGGAAERAAAVGDRTLAAIASGGSAEALSDARLDIAGVLSQGEQFERSIPMLERVVASRPDSIEGQFLLASAYERTGRDERAESVFEDLIDQDPEFHLALNYLGYMWAEQGENLDRALDLVQRAVELQPQNGAYIDSLGWIYFQLGRYEEAVGHLERAAELEPTDSTVQEHLGDAYRALGRLGAARAAYERALDLGLDGDAVRGKLRSLNGSD